MKKGLSVVVLLAACFLLSATAALGAAPPGATALCTDGTYSFSATHSGTCSHHGGVAVWLDGSTGGGSGGSPGGTAPAVPISGQLLGFASGQIYNAYTLCFASYGASLSSGVLDWGDGTTSDVGASASGIGHTYIYGGSYAITLTCRDSASYVSTQTTNVSITGPPKPVAPSPPTATTTTTTTTSAVPSSSPASGATAKCSDGTYSYSPTHSGTCSHHGGVAVWLDGSTGGSMLAGVGAKPTSAGAVRVGTTKLLAHRTRTIGCRLGANPDRRCSPGAYYSALTKAVICSSSFHTSSIRNVSESGKHAVEAEYGMAPHTYGSTLEIDHIVSLELGGSNDISNLFPEQAVIVGGAGYHVKDKLENRLHDMVCAGQIGLRAAQRQIASNWQALYKQVFGTLPVRRLALHNRIPAQWKNCTAVNRKYRHGVGRAGAHDHTTDTPVTTFKRNTRLYKLAFKYNRGLDRDHDGIACEKA